METCNNPLIQYRNQCNSPLLRLAAELRNRIHRFTVREGFIEVFPILHDRKPQAFGLFMTCRQTHAEASALIFPLNTFVFQGPRQIDMFAQKMEQQNLDNIRSICLDTVGAWAINTSVGWDKDVPEMRLLPSLDVVHVRRGLDRAYWDSVGLALRQVTGRMALEVIFQVEKRWMD